MSKIDTGGPAFPADTTYLDANDKPVDWKSFAGLSWLDYAAIEQMPFAMARTTNYTEAAKEAYGAAQALLAEKRRLENE